MNQSGQNNSNWRGGRSVASNGYVLIRVGTSHHLADVRGYAYEHRMVAEKKLGRRLKAGELIHHLNHDRADNRPENIEVMPSRAHHHASHRSAASKLRPVGAPNPEVSCSCGCGATFDKYDGQGRPRRFLPSHNLRINR